MTKTKDALISELIKTIDAFWYGTSDDDLITSIEVPVVFNGIEDGLMLVEGIEELE